jgi:hypothetical protein
VLKIENLKKEERDGERQQAARNESVGRTVVVFGIASLLSTASVDDSRGLGNVRWAGAVLDSIADGPNKLSALRSGGEVATAPANHAAGNLGAKVGHVGGAEAVKVGRRTANIGCDLSDAGEHALVNLVDHVGQAGSAGGRRARGGARGEGLGSDELAAEEKDR